MHPVKTAQFEGPLDLLLQLIEEQKLDITQMSLASVTEQYLKVLQEVGEQMSAGDLADFLAIAARLLLIKSRALLPYLQPPEADEGLALENQLKLYREFLLASQQVHKLLRKRRFSFTRERLLMSVEPSGFTPPPNLTLDRLTRLFAEVVAALPPILPQGKGTIAKTVSVFERIQQLRDLIWRETKLRFSQIMGGSHSRMEVIVSFLAVLELTKQRRVMVKQDELFEEIVIEKLGE
ncbi:MAG: ScpA family protein [Patescibacteria group bacterium]|nr:ScpA family protein [Patescibacteria group bacterium]